MEGRSGDLVTRELDIVELGYRATIPLDMENQPLRWQREAWVTYLAQVAGGGGSR